MRVSLGGGLLAQRDSSFVEDAHRAQTYCVYDLPLACASRSRRGLKNRAFPRPRPAPTVDQLYPPMFSSNRPRLIASQLLAAASRKWFAAGIFGLGFISSAHCENLLQNGSFEEVQLLSASAQAGGFGYLSPVPVGVPHGDEQASLAGWTFTPGSVSVGATQAAAYSVGSWYANDHLPPYEGAFAVTFGVYSGNGGGTLSQVFPARAGASYSGRLSVARIGGLDPISAAVEIHLPGGGGVVHRQLVNLSTFNPYQWRQVAFSFDAPAGLAVGNLEFRLVDLTEEGAAPGADFVVDDISLEEMTAPIVSLLQDGGFEGAVLTSAAAQASGFGYLGFVPASTPHDDELATLPAWTFTPNAASAGASLAGAYGVNSWYARDHLAPRTGAGAVAFGVFSPHGGGTLSQTFVARAGAQYSGTLALARIAGGDPIGAAVEIHRPGGGGLVYRQVFDLSGFSAYLWREVTFGFTAPGDVDGLLEFRFIDLTPDNSSWGTDVVLDDVALWESAPPPTPVVANAGQSQTVRCLMEVVEVTLDGSASTGPAGVPLAYRWEEIRGDTVRIIGSTARVTTNVAPGISSFRLVVSTTNGQVSAATTDVTAIAVPTIKWMTPDSVAGDSHGLTVTLQGWNFSADSVVTWGASPRSAIYVPPATDHYAELKFQVTDADLVYTGEDFRHVLVQVRNGAERSGLMAFVIFSPKTKVEGIATGVAGPATTTTVTTTVPTSSGSATTIGASLTNTAGDPVSITTAAYATPVGTVGMSVGGSAPTVYDIRATGVDSADVLRVKFTYPYTITGKAEASLRVAFVARIDPVKGPIWDYVLSHTMIRDTTDFVAKDTNVRYGGTITVVFDDTTYPRLTELTGTPFSFGVPDPTISLESSVLVAPVASERSVTVSYNAVGFPADHQLSLAWADGLSVSLPTSDAHSAIAKHRYTAPGIYTLGGSITEASGAAATATLKGLVAYDPDAGFVSAAGWFNSAAGAVLAQPGLTGKMKFEVNSKYQKSAATPSGTVDLTLPGNQRFSSTMQEWLVVRNTRAALKARGRIDGAGDYDVFIVIEDGDISSPRGADRIRVRVSEHNGDRTVYDNRVDAAQDLSSSTQAVDSGSIVLHRGI